MSPIETERQRGCNVSWENEINNGGAPQGANGDRIGRIGWISDHTVGRFDAREHTSE